MQPRTLGVIGLGAVGGSVAWRAARSGVQRVIGYSAVPKDGVAAVRAGAVTELVQDAKRLVRRADFVVLAVPPKAALAVLRSMSEWRTEAGWYVTDVAGTKQPLVDRAGELGLEGRFAGSDAVVDIPQEGFAAATPDLFVGRIVYVTPIPDGERAAREIADFWKRVMGAQPVMVDAATHDALVAWTAHLPHVVASALAYTLGTRGPQGVTYGEEALSLTGRAGGRVDQWAETLLFNRHMILEALQDLDRSLTDFKSVLASNDLDGVRNWLEAGAGWRRRAGS